MAAWKQGRFDAVKQRSCLSRKGLRKSGKVRSCVTCHVAFLGWQGGLGS